MPEDAEVIYLPSILRSWILNSFRQKKDG